MKKISRRSFLQASGVAAAMAALTACGASDSTTTTTTTSTSTSTAASTADAATDEHVTIKWSVWQMEDSIHFVHLRDTYNELNPNVTIELVDLGITDYQTAITTQLSGNSDEIDLVSCKDMANYVNLSSLGMLDPMNDYADASGFDVTQLSGLVTDITYDDGTYYALPFTKQFWMVFYNKDHFDTAGVPYPTNDMTWDEYYDLAEEVTFGSGADKVYGCYYHSWNSCVQLSGILDGEHTIYDGDYEFFKPIYERVLQQQADGICMDYSTIKTASLHYSGVFQASQISMMNNGNWYIPTQIGAALSGEATSTNWGIVKYPHFDGCEPGTTLGTSAYLGVNANSKNKQATYDFIEWVCGLEGALVVTGTGAVPAFASDEVNAIITSMEGFPDDDNSKEAMETYKIYPEMPMHVSAADVQTALNTCHDNIMTENVTIDEGIATLEAEVAGILGL